MSGIPKYDHGLIYKLLKDGLSIKNISERVGCSVGAVKGVKLKKDNPEKYKTIYKNRWQRIKHLKNKLPENKWKTTKPRVGNYEEISLKYKDGKTVNELAEEYNCHLSTIRKIINGY